MAKSPSVLLVAVFALLCGLSGPRAFAQEITPEKKGKGSLPHTMLDQAMAAGFVPHRAIYEVRLVKTQSGSQVLNIRGQMLYEWQPVCDAWISNHHFNILYEYVDSAPMKIVSDFSTYETFDGRNFSFLSQRKRDGELFEEIRGQAEIPPGKEGNAGKATYALPSPTDFALPSNTLFPMGHALGLLHSIRAGKTFYNTVSFEGSDMEGPVEVNSFIGKMVDPYAGVEKSPAIDPTLISSPARRIRMAFFPLHPASDDSGEGPRKGGDDGTSEYESSIVFHENGVMSEITLEYDDFTLTQKLLALEPLGDGCGQSPARLNE